MYKGDLIILCKVNHNGADSEIKLLITTFCLAIIIFVITKYILWSLGISAYVIELVYVINFVLLLFNYMYYTA